MRPAPLEPVQRGDVVLQRTSPCVVATTSLVTTTRVPAGRRRDVKRAPAGDVARPVTLARQRCCSPDDCRHRGRPPNAGTVDVRASLTISHRTIVRQGGLMDSVIYLVGLIVVVMVILSALGLR